MLEAKKKKRRKKHIDNDKSTCQELILGLNCKDDILSPDGHGWEACDMRSKFTISCCNFYQLIFIIKTKISRHFGTINNMFCIIKHANSLESKIFLDTVRPL